MSTLTAPRRALVGALALSVFGAVAEAQPRSNPAATTQPAATQPAATQPAVSPEVEAEHARGIELRRQHLDAEAREVFRALYARTQEPRALARQAAAEAAMGDWSAAEEHLATALRASSDPWITQNHVGLEADLHGFREHLGLLEITSTTPGAEVWLSGARAATLPLEHPLRVPAGTLAVELRAEGFITEVRAVNVPGGMSVPARERINLTPMPRMERPDVLPTPTPTPTPTPSRVEAGVPTLRIVAGVVLGLGAVSLGAGVAGFALREGAARAFNNDPSCGTAALTPACRTLYDEGQTERTLGIVGFAVGSALAVGGATLLVLSFRTSSRAVALTQGPGDVGLSLRARF